MKRRGIGARELTQQGIAICLFPEQPPIEKYEEYIESTPKTNQVFAAAPTRVTKEDEDEEEMFENRAQYIVCFLCFCLSLHNVYYFPLQMFRHGGGSFFLAYTIMSFFFAYPLHFLQTFLGQYGRCGIVKIWDLAPIGRGIGWAMVLSAIFVCILYNIYASYALVYLANSFRMYPPWYDCYDSTSGECAPRICSPKEECPLPPSQHYFYNYVVNQNRTTNPLLTDGMGMPLWWLILGLLYAWFIVFICCRQGIRSIARATPFLLIFPYFGIFTLFVLSLQLTGASIGLYRMFLINEMIAHYSTWYFAAIQIFNELGVTHGVPLVYGSFCHPQHLCQFSSLYICIINYVNSIVCGVILYCFLGYLSVQSESEFGTYFVNNVGLVFATYSEALSRVPASTLWFILLFISLFCVVIGTINGLILTLTVVLFDLKKSLKKIRGFITLIICLVFFLIGFLFCFSSGFLVSNLLDVMPIFRTVLIFIGFFTLVVVYFYKMRRVNEDCYELLEFKPIGFVRFCLYAAPIVLLILALAGLIGAWTPEIDSVYYSFIAYIIFGWVVIVIFIIIIDGFAMQSFIMCSDNSEAYYMFSPAESWGHDRGDGFNTNFKKAFTEPWTTK